MKLPYYSPPQRSALEAQQLASAQSRRRAPWLLRVFLIMVVSTLLCAALLACAVGVLLLRCSSTSCVQGYGFGFAFIVWPCILLFAFAYLGLALVAAVMGLRRLYVWLKA